VGFEDDWSVIWPFHNQCHQDLWRRTAWRLWNIREFKMQSHLIKILWWPRLDDRLRINGSLKCYMTSHEQSHISNCEDWWRRKALWLFLTLDAKLSRVHIHLYRSFKCYLVSHKQISYFLLLFMTPENLIITTLALHMGSKICKTIL
jgi:hypothetical protein